MPKVTIIMPSLNVHKYIRQCVESVITQTLADIEIILIDAGSTDGTLEILQEYTQKDKRITLFHSDVKSYGYQVNMGIALAKSEYIGIVETDDYILPDLYETLYKIAIQNKADYVKGNVASFIELKNGLKWSRFTENVQEIKEEIICPRNTPELLLKDYYIWTGIYKKELLKEVKLNETKGAAFQDIGFLFQTISMAKKAVYIDKIGYFYRQDNESTSSVNSNGFRYMIWEYTFIEPLIEKKNKKWKWAYYYKMAQQMTERFRRMALSKEFWEDKKEDMKWVRKKLKSAIDQKILTNENVDQDTWFWINLFLDNERAVYDFFQKDFRRKFSETRKLLEEVGTNHIVIFGCGRYGKFTHVLLEFYRQGQVTAFCDNNELLWNTQVQSVCVVSPKDIIKKFYDCIYVVANAKNAEEIKVQLRTAGIDEDHIYIYIPDFDIRVFACSNLFCDIL